MNNSEFERRFLLDYVWFGRMVLAHQNRVLNKAYLEDTDYARRSACFLAMHTNLIQECEHVAAWLLALRRWAEMGTALIETLLRYAPGEAYLEDRLEGIADGHELLRVSGIHRDRIVPQYFPEDLYNERVADIWAGLAYYANQQNDRATLYNKSKHAMMFLSSPKALNPELEDNGPIALYAKDRRAESIQVSYAGLTYDPQQPAIIARQTLGLAHALGDILLFYMLQVHPEAEADINVMLHTRASMLILP